ncbi:MAG: hypothetical protein TUN42_09580 [Dehalogenimonas sp.]
MSRYNFALLYALYPEVIRQMPRAFTAHEFILELARQNQARYIEALSAYSDLSPFMVVHGQLAKGLRRFPEIVRYLGYMHSRDIFGLSQNSSNWEKV